MSDEQIAEAEAHADERDVHFELWEENAESFGIFLAVASQWRVTGGLSGLVYLGLDYASCAELLRARGIAANAGHWSDLQILEDAACEALNSRK